MPRRHVDDKQHQLHQQEDQSKWTENKTNIVHVHIYMCNPKLKFHVNLHTSYGVSQMCPGTILPTSHLPRTIVPTSLCAYIPLCPHLIVPTYHYANVLLCPCTIVPMSHCARITLCSCLICRHTIVPTYYWPMCHCAHIPLCPHLVVPAYCCCAHNRYARGLIKWGH